MAQERTYDLRVRVGKPRAGSRPPIPHPDFMREGTGTPQSTDGPTGWDAIEWGIQKSKDKFNKYHPGLPNCPLDEALIPAEDAIPMHRACGDEVATPHGRGTVILVKRGVALIECGSRFYVEKGQDINELDEEQVYELSQTIANKLKPMKPVPLSELEEMEDGFPLPCVEGTLSNFWNKPKTGEGQNGTWTLYDGTLSADGVDVKVTFWMDSLPEGIKKGDDIRITCGKDKKGKPAGLSKSVRDSRGKTYHSIRVDDRATIELSGDSAQSDSAASKYQEGQSSAPPPTTQGKAPAAQKKGIAVEGSQATFEHRLKEYRKAFLKVADYFELGLSLDQPEVFRNVKEITTGLCMSFKGQYGVYADIIWENPQATEEALVAGVKEKFGAVEVPDEPSPTKKTKKPSWQDFVHPARKVSLGVVSEDAEVWPKLAFWALQNTDKNGNSTLKTDKQENLETQANVLLGIEDVGPDYRDILMVGIMSHKDYGTKFDDQAFMAYLKQAYKTDQIKKLTDAQVIEIIREFPEAVEEMKNFHKAAPAKGADDDDSLPP